MILRIKLRTFSELFDATKVRISFQNRLLLFILYRCGGFIPSSADEEVLRRQASTRKCDVIRRHGTLRDEHLKEMLSFELYGSIEKCRALAFSDAFVQSDKPRWPGGYFGFPGPKDTAIEQTDTVKAGWRKEYMPGSVSLLAASFCASISGLLLKAHGSDHRFRVTIHRVIYLNDETLLQQCCEYVGTSIDPAATTTGRTFPAETATIGLAFGSREVIRTKHNIDPKDLVRAMETLNLNVASRRMSEEVSFIMAIPLLEPDSKFYMPSPVSAILYIDSTKPSYFIDDTCCVSICDMLQSFGNIFAGTKDQFDRLGNIPLTSLGSVPPLAKPIPGCVANVFHRPNPDPPRSSEPIMFNFDHSDFVPAEKQESL